MAAPTAPAPAFEFPDSTNEDIGQLARAMKAGSILLIILGLLRLALGLIALGDRDVDGVHILIEGVLLVFLGLVLHLTSVDTRYIVQTKGSDTFHFGNMIKNLAFFFKVQLGLGVIALIALVVALIVN